MDDRKEEDPPLLKSTPKLPTDARGNKAKDASQKAASKRVVRRRKVQNWEYAGRDIGPFYVTIGHTS